MGILKRTHEREVALWQFCDNIGGMLWSTAVCGMNYGPKIRYTDNTDATGSYDVVAPNMLVSVKVGADAECTYEEMRGDIVCVSPMNHTYNVLRLENENLYVSTGVIRNQELIEQQTTVMDVSNEEFEEYR